MILAKVHFLYVLKSQNVASGEEEESVRKERKTAIIHLHMSSRHFTQDQWGQTLWRGWRLGYGTATRLGGENREMQIGRGEKKEKNEGANSVCVCWLAC